MRKFVIIFIFFSSVSAGTLTPKFKNKIEKAKRNESIRCFIFVRGKPNLFSFGKGRYREKIRYLRQFSAEKQKGILREIEKNKKHVREYESFWILNGIYLHADKKLIYKLSGREDIIGIDMVPRYHIYNTQQENNPLSVEWNISKIKADSVWYQEGFTGKNVIIGILDTGIDASHPAVKDKFLGYWFDAVNGGTYPYDDNKHGTHVTGTILGGDGPGPFTDDIGVAYDTKFISAKAFNSGGAGYLNDILEAMQWFVSLKADSGIDIRAVSNSWGGPSDTVFWQPILVWRSFDIIPVFAIGNSGPGSGTTQSPGDYPMVIGVGATDAGDDIADFSSRGPAPDQYPWNDTIYWPTPDWNLIKPNICAPGVNVRSSVPGGGYESHDGTSMATPHITGVIALILEKNPSLGFDEVYSILLNSADHPPQGGNYPNNNYGWGRVNALSAMQNTPWVDTTYIIIFSIKINDSTGGNGNGIAEPGEDVEIHPVLRNHGAPAINLSGTLRVEQDSMLFIYDSLALYGDINTGNTCSGDGFQMHIDSGWEPGQKANFHLVLNGNGGAYTHTITFNLEIGRKAYSGPDTYGYYALDDTDTLFYQNAPSFEWIELKNTGTPIYLADDAYRKIALPFNFSYYGQFYDSVYICSNGMISFEEGSVDFTHSPIPSQDGPSAMVAGYWCDLSPGSPARAIWTFYDTLNHFFVIEYDSFRINNTGSKRVKFEITLYDPQYHQTPTGDGEITVQYLSVPSFSSYPWYTAGIESPAEDDGIMYYYNYVFIQDGAQIQPGRAIKYTTKLEQVVKKEENPSVSKRLILSAPRIMKDRIFFRLTLPYKTKVYIYLYSVNGRKIFEMQTKPKSRILTINIKNKIGSGVYFLHLKTKKENLTEKFLLLK